MQLTNKESILFPYINSEGVWNLAVIENLSSIIKTNLIKKEEKSKLSERRSYTPKSRPRMSIFIFEDLQEENRDEYKKIIKYFDNFLSLYFKMKHDEEDYLNNSGWLHLKLFDLKICSIGNCKLQDDTGLIIGQIMMDLIEQRDDVKSYINHTVGFFKLGIFRLCNRGYVCRES